jgi:hypothetical protein
MEEETREFLRERSDRIRLLHENQAKELERFDDESVRLGFRFLYFSYFPFYLVYLFFIKMKLIVVMLIHFSALAIAEPPRETYGDDDSDSMTGSTLSLNRPGKCE